jgi:hypothetical protein
LRIAGPRETQCSREGRELPMTVVRP